MKKTFLLNKLEIQKRTSIKLEMDNNVFFNKILLEFL